MNDTVFIDDRLKAMHLDPEARARALQAAYIGEVVTGALAGIGRSVARLVKGWREWSERRQSLAYLERLDERLLADIGLSHATLEEALRRPSHKLTTELVPPVEAVITEGATVANPANQDRGEGLGTRRKVA